MLMTSIALKKDPQECIFHCTKAWSGELGHAYTEAVGLTGDDATSTKCLLDTLEGDFKPRSNKIVAVTAYKQLVQGDLGLLEYIENAKKSQQCVPFAQHMINAYEMQYYYS